MNQAHIFSRILKALGVIIKAYESLNFSNDIYNSSLPGAMFDALQHVIISSENNVKRIVVVASDRNINNVFDGFVAIKFLIHSLNYGLNQIKESALKMIQIIFDFVIKNDNPQYLGSHSSLYCP
ncbi:hypothetical protein MXB_3727 [Myxobolus squamalis]|nr:hypothetical protein MXB_3727 [Myxobolus squamalis]